MISSIEGVLYFVPILQRYLDCRCDGSGCPYSFASMCMRTTILTVMVDFHIFLKGNEEVAKVRRNIDA